MTSSPSFPIFLRLQTLLSTYVTEDIPMTDSSDWFGPSLMAFTHKLETWNILLCIRKGNAAKIYKIYRDWVPGEQSWITFFGFSSRIWAKYYSLWNFIAKVTEIIFVWLMLWKDMMIRYSTVWIFKNGCLVIKNVIYEKVFPL